MELSTSPKYALNSTDFTKAVRGLVITLFAAGGISVLEKATELLTTGQVELGSLSLLQPLLISLLGFGIELLRRYLTAYSAK